MGELHRHLRIIPAYQSAVRRSGQDVELRTSVFLAESCKQASSATTSSGGGRWLCEPMVGRTAACVQGPKSTATHLELWPFPLLLSFRAHSGCRKTSLSVKQKGAPLC